MLWIYVTIAFTFCSKFLDGSLAPNRRLSFSKRSYSDKKFMVYLLRSEISNKKYNNWLCGGAIVSPRFILTSAACLRDVPYLYVIAGYKKYVRTERLNEDPCTKRWKQKVVKTCVPRRYNFTYELTHWMYLDIGFAIVEHPYNFSDITYRDYCSFTPAPIRINYDPKYTQPGISALSYGWGHPDTMRENGDYQDYNSNYMREIRTLIAAKQLCYDEFSHLNISHVMEYIICCRGLGFLDSEGRPEEIIPTYISGFRRTRRMKDATDNMTYVNSTSIESSKRDRASNDKIDLEGGSGRRQGVCQNDHGGPLVGWIGPYEYVLGVAITSKIYKGYLCRAPYMYTSTQCASRFVKCVMNHRSITRRMCDNIGIEEGYIIDETEIDWSQKDKNKAGNVENETNVDTKPSKTYENSSKRNLHDVQSQNNSTYPFENDDDKDIFKYERDSDNLNDEINDFTNGNLRTNLNENQNKESNDGIFSGFTDLDSAIDDVVII